MIWLFSFPYVCILWNEYTDMPDARVHDYSMSNCTTVCVPSYLWEKQTKTFHMENIAGCGEEGALSSHIFFFLIFFFVCHCIAL